MGMSVGDDEGSDDGEEENEVKETEEEQLRRKIEEVKELKRKKWEKWDKVGEDNSVKGVESKFGRLVVDEGRSRYINPSFWSSLSNEVS